VSEAEIMALPTGINHVDDLGCVPEEARWLVGYWMNKGTANPSKSPSAWMRKYGDQQMGVYWSKPVRERIASQLKYIRHWTITQTSYEDIPNMPATWFADAPYDNEAGEHYKYGRRGIDYVHLGDWCRSRSGQVIVCENAGATWLDFAPLGSFKGQRRKSEEVIWTNVLDRHRPEKASTTVEYRVVDPALLARIAQDSTRRIGNYALVCGHEIS
jgi:hypothetical protein